jgi:hypothetical protein
LAEFWTISEKIEILAPSQVTPKIALGVFLGAKNVKNSKKIGFRAFW